MGGRGTEEKGGPDLGRGNPGQGAPLLEGPRKQMGGASRAGSPSQRCQHECVTGFAFPWI